MSKKNYSKYFKFGDCTKTCAWCRAAPPQLQAGDEVGLGGAGDRGDDVDLGQVMMTMVIATMTTIFSGKGELPQQVQETPTIFLKMLGLMLLPGQSTMDMMKNQKTLEI